MNTSQSTITVKLLVGLLWSVVFCGYSVAQAATNVANLSAPDNPRVAEGPAQPINYSHQKHLALGLPCAQCHTQPEPKKQMIFPATDTCMGCHQVLAKDSPEIKKLAEYHSKKQPVPWVRVYQVMEGVNWSHEPHTKAGVDCLACHGKVADLPVMKQLKSSNTMGGCVDCHSSAQVSTRCETCHTNWSPEMIIDMKRMAAAVNRMTEATSKITSKTSTKTSKK